MHILIVEDDEVARDYLAKALREVGHTVDVAGDGLEGLHLASSISVDLAIVDRMLPKLDGLVLVQSLRAILLAVIFEWGIALHGLYAAQDLEATDAGKAAQKKTMLRKWARQAGKDYVLFPALSRGRWCRVLGANVVANLLRNVWAYAVIICGHFADGAEKFTPSVLVSIEKPSSLPELSVQFRVILVALLGVAVRLDGAAGPAAGVVALADAGMNNRQPTIIVSRPATAPRI